MSLFALVSPFYAIASGAITAGDLGRAIVAVPSPQPWALDVKRSDARTHDRVRGDIRGMERSDFTRSEILPVYGLGQRRDEALRVERVRRSLAVVLSTSTGAGGAATPPLSAIVAPLVAFDVDGRTSEFTPALRARVEALMHLFLFPCPQNDRPYVPASAVRLDRAHAMVPNVVTWEPLGVRLSEEALGLLLATCRQIFGSSSETELEEVRAVLADAVPPG